MDLILFRHGIAIERLDPACPPDPQRALTQRGAERTRAAARGLRALRVRPAAIVTSPLLRARQSAAIAAEELHAARRIETPALEPTRDPTELLELLRGITAPEVLCIGHAPHLDRTLARLLGYALPRLKKAGAARVELADDGELAQLAWYVTPRALRRLGDHG